MTLDKRNWPAIAKIEDQELRQFFMTVQHPVVLDGLAQSFPQFFLDEPREFCFPLSELMEKQLQIDREQDPRECNEQVRIESVRYQWGCATDAMMIPTLLLYALRVPGHQELTDSNYRFFTFSPELQIQLQHVDLQVVAGKRVSLTGVEMVVVAGCHIEMCVTLARADHIDLDS